MSDKITFNDLVKAFAEKHDITQTKAEHLIRQVFDYVVDDLETDGKAAITNFGSFKLKEVAERTGINPQTGEEIVIPAHKKVSFSPYKALEETVNAEFAHLESRLIEEGSEEKQEETSAPVQKDEDFDDPFGLDDSAEENEEEESELEPVAINTKSEESPTLKTARAEENDEEKKPPPVYKANPNERAGGTAWVWIVLLLIVGAAGIWFFFLRDTGPASGDEQIAQNNTPPVEEMQEPAEQPVQEEQPDTGDKPEEDATEESMDIEQGNSADEESMESEAPQKPGFSTYIIEKDEWMWDISREVYGKPFLWPLIFEANKSINDNPNLVEPSNTLMIPGLEGTSSSLTKGDYATLASAAKMVSDAYAKAGNQSRADEYLRFSKKYERQSKE